MLLYTIRHFTDAAAQTVEGKNVILKQITETMQRL
jgi:hypothetical protein